MNKNYFYLLLVVFAINSELFAVESKWKFTLDTNVTYRESPDDYNGAIAYNGNPLNTFIVNGKKDDFTEKYWQINKLYSLSYNLSESVTATVTYKQFKGDFQNTSTQSLGADEWSNMYSLVDGRRLGNIGVQNTRVNSIFKFRTEGESFGAHIIHEIGNFNYGLSYSFSQSQLDINLSQERDGFSHSLKEKIESDDNRIGLLLGYEVNLIDNLNVVLEADLGLVFSRDDYRANHFGTPEFRPAFAEMARDQNNYVNFNPEIKFKIDYTVGRWSLSPYALVGLRRSPTIDYDLPNRGELIDFASNSGVKIKPEEERYWGAGISLSLSF